MIGSSPKLRLGRGGKTKVRIVADVQKMPGGSPWLIIINPGYVNTRK